ncbi:aminoglycoside phosphotransferase family protein [Bacillus sp. SIMBA_154]|uniref:phosphotransferase enzyme family protein n=1 Tax=Bacillus sp. SIMBA_154 TaxID=3080859 RepID=UPI003978522A
MTNLDVVYNVLKCWFSEQPHRVTPLNGRSPNAGWLVEYTKNRFVLKKCVRNHNAEWLHYLEDLTDALLDHGFPIQPMIEAKNQHKTILYRESYWQLRPYFEGRPYEMGNRSDEQEAIRVLKKLHSLKNLPKGPVNPNCELKNWITYPDDTLNETACALKKMVSSKKAAALLKVYERELMNVLVMLNPSIYETLPHAVTHGDFHSGNLLIRNKKLAMVLDFDTAGYRPRIYDAAISAFLLTRIKRGTFQLDIFKTIQFLKTYAEDLSENEWRSISAFIRLLYIPTGRYLTLLQKHTPHFLNWYIDWSFQALQSASHQLMENWYLQKEMRI